ncbi:hypothetical protein MKX03_029838 [Papaver bracteatum]|nr:hypothetical protein MKX03_029838 [Papaver bracteatum]
MRLNSHLHTFPNAYYFSYATKKTRNLMSITLASSILGIHPRLFIRVLQMSQWTHPPDVLLPYKGYRLKDNDGAVSTISMTYPRLPTEHPNKFVENDSDCQPLQPGIWYHKIVEVDLILFFVVNQERARLISFTTAESMYIELDQHYTTKSNTKFINSLCSYR